MSIIVKLILTGQITKACILHPFLLWYKLCMLKTNKPRKKWIYTKYKPIPLKVNSTQRVSCVGRGFCLCVHALC